MDWAVTWLRARPAATWSLGSSRGTNTPAAGPPTAPNEEPAATRARIPMTGTFPVKPCTASSSEQTACPMVATRKIRRRSPRSTHDPANSPTTTSGTACASPTAPLQTALCVMSHTWNMTVTTVMKLPRMEAVRPISSRRKAGEVRRGRTSTRVRARLMRA